MLHALWRSGSAGGRWCPFGGACGKGEVRRWVEGWIRGHYYDEDVQILDCDVRTGRATICKGMGSGHLMVGIRNALLRSAAGGRLGFERSATPNSHSVPS